VNGKWKMADCNLGGSAAPLARRSLGEGGAGDAKN